MLEGVASSSEDDLKIALAGLSANNRERIATALAEVNQELSTSAVPDVAKVIVRQVLTGEIMSMYDDDLGRVTTSVNGPVAVGALKMRLNTGHSIPKIFRGECELNNSEVLGEKSSEEVSIVFEAFVKPLSPREPN